MARTVIQSGGDNVEDYIVKSTTITADNKVMDGKVCSEALADINDNLTASDGTKFRYGVTDDGKPGYIVTDSTGSDTVVPFESGGGELNVTIVLNSSAQSILYCSNNESNRLYSDGYINISNVTKVLVNSGTVTVNGTSVSSGKSVNCNKSSVTSIVLPQGAAYADNKGHSVSVSATVTVTIES